MMRKALILLICFSMPLITSGCWDVEEINRRAIADSIFFDTGVVKPFKVGFSLPIPGTQTPPVQGTQQQFEKRHFVITGEGDSVLEAWTMVQSNVARNSYFGQLRAVIISEKAARRDINNLLDFIGRFPLIPPNTNILVAKSDPENL